MANVWDQEMDCGSFRMKDKKLGLRANNLQGDTDIFSVSPVSPMTPHPSSPPSGFTLVELIVVIAIIGILSTLIIVKYAGKTDQARVAAAKAQISQIECAVIEFQANGNRLPRSLDELVNKPGDCPNWPDGGYLKGSKAPMDPWDHPYVFHSRSGSFEVVSLGADGKEGGSGVDRDLSSQNAGSGGK